MKKLLLLPLLVTFSLFVGYGSYLAAQKFTPNRVTQYSPLDLKTTQYDILVLEKLQEQAIPIQRELEQIKIKYCTLAKIPIEKCQVDNQGRVLRTPEPKK